MRDPGVEKYTFVKFMLTRSCVGMVGVWLLVSLGEAKLVVNPLVLGRNILGGLMFDAGWGLLGYCPATSLGAVAEGRWDAVQGLLGAVVGAGIYAQYYPWLKATVLTWGNYGALTLPQILHISPWWTIGVFVVLSLALFAFLEEKAL